MKKTISFGAIIFLSLASLLFAESNAVYDKASDIVVEPAGNISATDVQSAINELDDEKMPYTTTVYEQLFGNDDLSSGILDIEHSLGKKYCIVQVYDNNDKQIIPDDITLIDIDNLSIDISSWGTISGDWHCVILAGAN